MSSNISRRHLLSTGLVAVGGTIASAAFAAESDKVAPRGEKAGSKSDKAPAKGQVSLEALGKLLEAMGLKPSQYESSFNFTFPFKADIEWNMTMTATMSTDEEGIWITAFLSELPQSAADVPRTALLRLLAQNDELGNGIFFAYIPKVKKFVLERMIENEGITSASFKESIRELATRVSETQALWNTAEWKQSTTQSASATKEAAATDEKPGVLSGNKEAKPLKSATKESTTPNKR
jgi:hypothetical protein